ncbi:uncharacterized protein BDW43DRAFT_276131 [Aspergillus alliaceus]|uniref:uncharacterized protein n=1 Tax=Petromyces alliaceus TaxID=209559 RepID=UPI0012A66BDD|nr:uncharacterized protein BDW43DRAFT_276131 [Aspergillus alliaceus]KAB8233383.1 hypothetical protein BDW43DRAFT_276131 [Aspergillus alliaceus]
MQYLIYCVSFIYSFYFTFIRYGVQCFQQVHYMGLILSISYDCLAGILSPTFRSTIVKLFSVSFPF